jgi:hypothetical protein
MGKCGLCGKIGHNRTTCTAAIDTITLDLASMKTLDLETGEISVPVREERTKDSVLKLFNIGELTEKYKKHCDECSGLMYSVKTFDDKLLCNDCFFKKNTHCGICGNYLKYIYSWKDKVVCGICFITEKEKLSDAANDYIREKGMVSCSFCGKERDRVYGFHLDHINMFDKYCSIIDMIKGKKDIDLIKEEIDKCQLLCVDCHALVTGAENMCKFTQAKRKKIDERELYAEVMSEVYAQIAAARCGDRT